MASTPPLVLPSILLPVLWFGLMAGFFYAFSVCVMMGLDRIAAPSAIEAMQAINAAVRNPVFFATFFLCPLLAAGSALVLWRSGQPAAMAWMLGAGLLYILGAIIPTISINVPMNEALALVDPTVESEAVWTAYSARWTFWNTVRAVMTTASLALATLSALAVLR